MELTGLLKDISGAIDVAEFYSAAMNQKVYGKNNVHCPFPDRHKGKNDSTPSFKIFLDTGGAYCHGCGYKASHPAYFLSDLSGEPIGKAATRLYSEHVEKIIPQESFSEPATAIQENPLILSRLEKLRGITAETAKRYRLGYDGHRLTIPIFNSHGLCVNIRRYDLFKSGGPKMLSYAEGYGKTRLYPLESLKSRQIVVVEGELDALLGCQIGLSCISPSGGAMSWRDEWGKLFKGKDVIVIPDNDEPGDRGAAIRAKNISKHAASCTILKLPVTGKGEDLTDWIVKHGGTAQELRKLIKAATADKTKTSDEVVSEKTALNVLGGEDGSAMTKSEEIMIARAEAMWQDLTNGGAFFKNTENELFYAREGMAAMKVSSGLGPFMSFLSSRSPLVNQATSTGKFIYNHILYRAYSDSGLSKTAVWTMYDSGKLYIHAGKDRLLRIGAGKPDYIKNAVNDERILLDLPIPGMAIADLPAESPVEGLKQLRELFMSNLAMQEEDRYLLICWLSGIFLRDYVRPKPIVRLLAKTASGKSTSSKLVSMLLYGEELLSHSASTVAATYEMSTTYPLLILDNLEARNMTTQLEDFLLVAATGGMKAKRQMSTDRGLVLQQTNSLVMTNGIEPFSRHELIDRTMEIDLDIKKFGNNHYQEAKIFGQLRIARPGIIAALLFLMHQYVLPRVRKGELHRITREFGSHGKERFNEYLALMAVILDAFWGYMPLDSYQRPHDLVNFWLDEQTHAEQRQDEGTNEVLYYLNTLSERSDLLIGSLVKITKVDDVTTVRCTTRELLSEFRMLAKHLGLHCPWVNERHLGTRIVDSEETLNLAGWRRRPYVTGGRAHYEYTHKTKQNQQVLEKK